MRRKTLRLAGLVAVAFLAWAPSARAEGFVVPWAGVHFGDGDIDGRSSFGASAGYMGAGIIGGEFDFGYSPNFFDLDDIDNHAMTVMGNVIVGIPIGGTSGAGIRPYVTGGLGLIRTKVDTLLENDASNEFGFNLGAGVMGYFSDHVGLRGDVRYFRNITGGDADDLFDSDFDLGDFDFWRASIGLVIR
jgi:opacity protein-like surface antigen